MDYLQYITVGAIGYCVYKCSFKPCYKWITFNTEISEIEIKV